MLASKVATQSSTCDMVGEIMANLKKDAGEARQRPRRPAPSFSQKTGSASAVARPSGIAPHFAVAARQPAARTDAPKGMISTPWVRQWKSGTSGATPGDATTPPSHAPSPTAEATPRREARRPTSNAGPAPTPEARGYQ